MLILSRKINEKLRIGDDIVLTIIDIKGDQAKIGVEAPGHVKVYRQEVWDAIRRENREARLEGTTPQGLEEIRASFANQ